MRLGQYDGMAWFRDKSTGLRFRYSIRAAKDFPDLQRLPHPVDKPMTAKPVSKSPSTPVEGEATTATTTKATRRAK